MRAPCRGDITQHSHGICVFLAARYRDKDYTHSTGMDNGGTQRDGGTREVSVRLPGSTGVKPRTRSIDTALVRGVSISGEPRQALGDRHVASDKVRESYHIGGSFDRPVLS